MRKDKMTCNGYPVLISLHLVTEAGEGWRGSELIGSYHSMRELNKAINSLTVPMYWEIQVDFEDLIDEAEISTE